MLDKKWRGIKTTQERKNENEPITITNRLGQYSISLPRIDDNKRWAGYPSLSGTARRIAKIIPPCLYYVEPFAGTAKVYQELIKIRPLVTIAKFILNDKSDFIFNWLKANMTNTIITQDDFKDCILKRDSKHTVFLIDMPWFKSYYDQSFSCFDRESVKDYETQVLELCKTLKGKFIITTRKENQRMLKSGFFNYLVTSEYVLCGKYPRVLLTTNFKIKELDGITKLC